MAKWRKFEALKSSNILGYVQVICYGIAVLLGLLVTIPVGITLRNFHGKCILFAQLVWDNEVIYPWSEASCDYVLYMTLAVAVIYALLMGIFTLLAVVPKYQGNPKKFANIQAQNVRYILSSLNPVFLFINFVIFFLLLGSALIISVGLGEFCRDLVESMKERGTPIGMCIDSKDIDWSVLRVDGGMDKGVYGSSFYGSYSVASIAAWCLVVVWGILLLCDFSQCCRGCSCQKAVEKQRFDRSYQIAARRSRLATPIGTPGHITPRSYGQVPLASGYGPPQQQHHYQQQHAPSHGYNQPAQVHLQPLPPKY